MSKKERDWKLFVMQIMESINKIEEYIEGLNYEQFVRDEKQTEYEDKVKEAINQARVNVEYEEVE